MMRDVYRVREKKIITIGSLLLLFLAFVKVAREQHWLFFAACIAGIILCWGVCLKRYRSPRMRAYVVTAVYLVIFVWYGKMATSIAQMFVPFGIFLALIGLFLKKELLAATVAIQVALIVYHLFWIHTPGMDDPETLYMAGKQFIAILVMVYLSNYLSRENVKIREQLMDTIDTLKKTEHSKDEFMANVSHEIRTPLNTICGMSELLLSGELTRKAREEVFDIQVAGRNLQSIVSDVLDYSELESGKISLVEESYNFSSIMNDVLNMAIAQNEDKDLELIVDCDAKIPCGLIGDSEKIRRIMSAVINNAIKYTEQGCVVISVESRKEEYGVNLIINVKDTGIGMDAHTRENLFFSYNQVDTKKNRSRDGIGLGLGITKKFVDMMSGFISVESEPGKGSEFRIVIPQRVEDDRSMLTVKNDKDIRVISYINQEKYGMEQIRDSYLNCIEHMAEQLGVKYAFGQNLNDTKRRIANSRFTHLFLTMDEFREDPDYFKELSYKMSVILVLNRRENQEPEGNFLRIYKPFYSLSVGVAINGERLVQRMDGSHHFNRRFTAPEASVLVVDDNIMNLKVMEGLLRPYGLRLFTAESGPEAVRQLERTKVDLVFMDHMMPQMDGVEAFHRIRQKQGAYYQSVPIVALTANAIGGAREMFLEEGFSDFVAKPVEISNLERVLKQYLPSEKIIYQEKIHEVAVTETAAADEEMVSEEQVSIKEPPVKPMQPKIDRETGLMYMGDSEEDYYEILRIYYESNLENKEQIERLYEEKNWAEYAVMVHALKSTSLTIGAGTLSTFAKQQEQAAKQEDEQQIVAGHEEMMAEYADILAEIAADRTVYPDGAPTVDEKE
jgi:signal transduction histidine kinase/CheY-like chemotaxis protein/HPt (histidine-containing phosphotransfer) domain-containing protein